MSNKYTKNIINAIREAYKLSDKRGAKYVGSEQLLYGLLAIPSCRAHEILIEENVDPEIYGEMVMRNIDVNCPIEGLTDSCKKILDKTADIARRAGCDFIATEHVLYSILTETDCYALKYLRSMGIDIEGLTSRTKQVVFPKERIATDGSDFLFDDDDAEDADMHMRDAYSRKSSWQRKAPSASRNSTSGTMEPPGRSSFPPPARPRRSRSSTSTA